MFWIAISIFPFFAWATVSVIEKYTIVHEIENPNVFWVWQVFLASLVFVSIPFIGLDVPSFKLLALLALAGALYFFGAVPYFVAIKDEEATRVNILWNLIPVFTLIFGWVLFGSILNRVELLAFFALLSGAGVASIHAHKGKFVFKKSLLLMIFSCAMYALCFVILDYVQEFMSFYNAYIWNFVFMILASFTMFFFKKFRRDFIDQTKKINAKLGILAFTTALLDHSGIFFFVYALGFTPAAIVSAMEGFQSIFVFIYAVILTLFAPQILKEEIDRKNIFFKIIALILMMVGLVILAFSK